MKTLIIDDEPLARTIVKEFCMMHPMIEIVGEANDGFEAVKIIQEYKPDLLFLDIQMPKLNGFEVLELLNYTPQVIFTTAFDEYAIRAFDFQAIDYLLKPFSEERFARSIEKIQTIPQSTKLELLANFPSKYEEESKRIVIKKGNEIHVLATNDIDFIEAHDDYVKLYQGEIYFQKKKTLSYYETVLERAGFIRIHRSFLVNTAKLTRIEAYDKTNHLAILTSGMRLPISRSAYPLLKEKLGI